MAQLKVHGTDLSHHNPDPNFVQAKKAGLEWCIHKAVEGSTLIDGKYDERRQAARKAGIRFGAYGFARPDGGDAVAEARHLFKIAKPKAGDLVPALDFEVDYRDAEQWCRQWQAEMNRLLKNAGLISSQPLHYGPNDFGKTYKAARWVPRYNKNNTPPSVPWDIFQFSDGNPAVSGQVGFPGLGNVDLNFVNPAFDMRRLILEPIGPKQKFETLRVGHASMQSQDTLAQQEQDAKKIFRRAHRRKLTWITGTEAGDNAMWLMLKTVGKTYGFKMHRYRGNWVAVDERIIKPGSWSQGEVWIMDNDKVVGRGHDPAFPWVNFEHTKAGVGRISVASVHYPTRGRTPKDPNYEINREYAKAIAKWAKEHGKGKNLAFVGGDFNMPVKKGSLDIFFNFPLTPASAEVGKFFGTGHGPIDHIASYDLDGRVSATDWRVYNDRKLSLHTDHYFVEADFKVRLVK